MALPPSEIFNQTQPTTSSRAMGVFNDSCDDWDDINVKRRTSTPQAQANAASPAVVMSVNTEAANATMSSPPNTEWH
ncbi:hypothetical protein CFAM422_009923 [Trichoderma lentiforme]|uniref:Uncharacterized protein n=1 Tax=Trichoderma lentiforme TaxID=1567552 RepID=A0A9P4X924_9HYPO|nr:hypothetical protein CFAM422_009923 [Trichoderma lentiforme]